jgi:hypothetical protein
MFILKKLDIWSEIISSNPVWYFDATNDVHKRIEKNREPLFYSIVCHEHVIFYGF